MGTRIKTFDATGTAPNGRLYAGDLNLFQDQYADQMNFGQTLGIGSIQIGESGLQLLRYGPGEARISGALRTDGVLRALGGLFAGTYTTTQRNAISSPPYGLLILNTTTNQFEWNAGTPSVPNWQPVSPPAGTISTSGIADGAVTSAKIADGTIALVDISGALKPSGSASSTDEALRALGTGSGQAARGDLTVSVWSSDDASAGLSGQVAANTWYPFASANDCDITIPSTGTWEITWGAQNNNGINTNRMRQDSLGVGVNGAAPITFQRNFPRPNGVILGRSRAAFTAGDVLNLWGLTQGDLLEAGVLASYRSLKAKRIS